MMNEEADKPEQHDNEEMMNSVAKECMAAINNNDHAGFKDSMHVLMADLLNKMQPQGDD